MLCREPYQIAPVLRKPVPALLEQSSIHQNPTLQLCQQQKPTPRLRRRWKVKWVPN
jgi:hypothetical protein